MTATDKMAQYVANWQDERNGAALYRAISEVEQDPPLKRVYQRLAQAEERHSSFWEAKLRATGQPLPLFRLNWRMRTPRSQACALRRSGGLQHIQMK